MNIYWRRYFDPTGTGSVKKEDFSAGLAALVATAEVRSLGR